MLPHDSWLFTCSLTCLAPSASVGKSSDSSLLPNIPARKTLLSYRPSNTFSVYMIVPQQLVIGDLIDKWSMDGWWSSASPKPCPGARSFNLSPVGHWSRMCESYCLQYSCDITQLWGPHQMSPACLPLPVCLNQDSWVFWLLLAFATFTLIGQQVVPKAPVSYVYPSLAFHT